VFGWRGGKALAEFCQGASFAPLPVGPEAEAVAELEHIRTAQGKERAAVLRSEMQQVMMDNVGVFRTSSLMQVALDKIRDLQARFKNVQIDDKGQQFNTDLLETFELGCLLDVAEVTAAAALRREESRGAHYRDDFPQRDDANWLNHSFVWKRGGQLEFRAGPVVITKFQPQERKY